MTVWCDRPDATCGRHDLARAPLRVLAVGRANRETDVTDKRRSGRADGEATRARILEAAVRRFAKASYDAVSLREIAGDVGVDVAYVHRSFGSKDRLFAQALRAASGGDVMAGFDPGAAGASAKVFAEDFVNRLVEKSRDRPYEGIDPLDIMIHSLGSRKAAAILREKVRGDFVAPLSERFETNGGLRAGMIVAMLIGTGIARDLLKLDALGDPDNEEPVLELLKKVITALIDER